MPSDPRDASPPERRSASGASSRRCRPGLRPVTSDEELVRRTVKLAGGALELLQPAEAFELPDSGGVEWAPLAPYWAVLWRSGVALAAGLDSEDLTAVRVVELGCGLGLPSLAAARAGATVLATDQSADALALLGQNARANECSVSTLRLDWSDPEPLLARGPFDLVLAADVLYERESVDRLAALMPRLAPRALLADPGRPAAAELLERLALRSPPERTADGVVGIYRLELG